MSVRIQVVLPEEEQARFARQAAQEGLSLSAWMRRAGRKQLEVADKAALPRGPDELAAFFAACDAREEGREPDWDEHLEVIRRSRTPEGPSN